MGISLLLLTAAMSSGCAPRALIVNTNSLNDEAVLFDTIRLDPNHLHGIYIKSIDNLPPYGEQTPFRRFYGNEDCNSLAWVIPAGSHRVELVFQESATFLGKTAKTWTTVTVEMIANGLYVPETTVVGDEVEWRIIDKRSGTTQVGPWRTPLKFGFTFMLDPFLRPLED